MSHEMPPSLPAIGRRALVKGGAALAAGAFPLLMSISPSVSAADGAVVKTASGAVRGGRSGAAHVFKGIPYAASTAGANRFMPPRPTEPWTAVRDATSYGPQSPGLGYPPFLMREEGVDLDKSLASEDSLVLNVWTPGPDAAARRPVMVWYHGGGYTSGSGGSARYDGTRLATRRDVVVVTVNHRIGALGFLHLAGLGDERFAEASNLGMQDIVQSLQWVRDNIAEFGGDPGNVTVFGESGGGGKVSTLMAMPAARGLFHKAVAQSGTALRAMPADAATRLARDALAKLGIGEGELDRLRTLPFDRIAAATPGNIGPVLDGKTLPRHPFDPDAPSMSAAVPMLLGSNLTEITFFNDTPLDAIDDEKLLASLAGYTRQDPAKVAPLVALYKKNRPGVENHRIYQAVATDWWMTSSVRTQADRKAASNAASVYVYQFAMPQGARGGKLHVPHTAEIAYVFDNLALSSALVGDATPEHQALADRMSAAWAAFARTGRPDAGGGPEWPAYSAARRSVMVLDSRMRVESAPQAEELAAVGALKSVA